MQQVSLNKRSKINLVMSLIMICFTFFYNNTSAQKYNFIQYSVSEGLVQSQAFSFVQNEKNELFIGTFGGLSRFDGSSFKNYTKSQGLPHNGVIALAKDKNHHLWIGTSNGIAKFDGVTFENYKINSNSSDIDMVADIKIDKNHSVWAIIYNKLYVLENKQFIKVDFNGQTILSSTLDKDGKLWISILNEGIFIRDKGDWHQYNPQGNKSPTSETYKLTFGKKSGKIVGLTSQGIFEFQENEMLTPSWVASFPRNNQLINQYFEDSKGNIWITIVEEGGAWMYNQKEWIFYDFHNGFTDELITSFFEDNEQNIWMATNGNGIFRFTGNAFVFYDRNSGLKNPSVTAITQSKEGKILLSGNKGLFEIGKEKINQINLNTRKEIAFNYIYTDSKQNTWLGSNVDGLFKYENGQIKPIVAPKKEQDLFAVLHIYEHQDLIWVVTFNGLFKIENDQTKQVDIPFRVNVIHTLDKENLLLGTFQGAYIFNIQTGTSQLLEGLENATIYSLASNQAYIFIGTDDRGIVVYDKSTHNFQIIGAQQGLSCEYIYSLLVDRKNNLWAGTGCGIDKISLQEDKIKIRNYGQSNGLGEVENNSNASFEDSEGYIWFGTTSRLFRYHPDEDEYDQKIVSAPQIIFESIKLFSRDVDDYIYADSTLPFSKIPINPIFKPSQNHLSFTFKAISLSSPKDIKYRYQLIGIDKHYTETNENTVVYPNLPTGEYIFRIWASDADRNWSANYVDYPFTIITPFYQTIYFIIGFSFIVLAFIFGGFYYRNRLKTKRIKWEMQLREEEQSRVRQRTAEDFHDEIGNKLTRINLLATIAENKASQENQNQLKPILNQIKDNVNLLYAGSKDIIWSLQPESDYLNEIIWKIQLNTMELLEGSPIQFNFEQIGEWDNHFKLKIDSSRNIILIFKEAVNNMVKYAGASHLVLQLSKTPKEIIIKLIDNGKGFDENTIIQGNGLNNMSNRAKRIKADLEIKSVIGKGTEVILKIQNSKEY